MAEAGVSVTDIHGALARCSVLHEHCQGFKRAERPFHLELKRFVQRDGERRERERLSTIRVYLIFVCKNGY